MPTNIHSLKKIPPHLESKLIIDEYHESEKEMKRLGLKKDKEELERPKGTGTTENA